MDDAATALNVEAELTGVADVSAAAVADLAHQAIADGVDGIALNISEPVVFAKVIAGARAKGIAIVAFNIDAGRRASGNLSYIMQDFQAAGTALGQRAIASVKRGAAAIITIHDEGVGALEERFAGVKAVLDGHGVRSRRVCVGPDPERGAEILLDLAGKQPVQAILGTGQADTEAAGLAARSLGPMQPYVAGFDLSPRIVDLMADGFIDATIDQQPYLQGFYPVVQLTLYLRYGLLPPSMDAGAAIVDRTNLGVVRQLSRVSIR